MSRPAPRLFTIDPGVAFLPELADALLDGRLVEGFSATSDPLALAGATVYVPTRRAARALRAIFAERAGAPAAILPTIRPLGEFDEDAAFFDESAPPPAALDPPVGSLQRLLALAPLVQLWKQRLPAHVAAMFEGEPVTVPATFADALWLSRDLAELIDEVERDGADWAALAGLADADLAGWWQVTLEFLKIATEFWPAWLAENRMSNPGAHRNAAIEAEAQRLRANPPSGPVVAAGSTGSIPATAALLKAIALLPQGAVVLPGLDRAMDAPAWSLLSRRPAPASVHGHPQFGLAKLLAALQAEREEVMTLGEPTPALAARRGVVSQALRPAEATEAWIGARADAETARAAGAFDTVSLVEAANEHEEAVAIALCLRAAIERPGARAALVTGDRALARRVSAELLRFGIEADDSGGTPLAATPPAVLMRLLVACALRPGDPVALVALLKHPLLRLSMQRPELRAAVELLELAGLRGGTGRPDIARLPLLLDERLAAFEAGRKPFWWPRLTERLRRDITDAAARLAEAVEPLTQLREAAALTVPEAAAATAQALEALVRDPQTGLADFYGGEAGERLAELLRALIGAGDTASFPADQWPDVLEALIGGEIVKPRPWSDPRITIWGQLEARLQTVDRLVVGGLNEGSWPRRVEADRFMSRLMKADLALDPPERRIGQAAHDFEMAMGARDVVLTRALRADNAPSLPSRWLQRLLTFGGEALADQLHRRGADWLAWARTLDTAKNRPFAERPCPRPPLAARPKHFSVTEIETLRRDPYAIHAKRILKLEPLEELLRDPGAAERGTLFHDILHRFTQLMNERDTADPLTALLAIGHSSFEAARLPPDIAAVWWPRFEAMAGEIVAWEAARARPGLRRLAEIRAEATPVGPTGVTLSARADRIDLDGAGAAAILDYKTGSTPTRRQAATLLAPQLALEGALLQRGAFGDAAPGSRLDSLALVRLTARGEVKEERLEHDRDVVSAAELADDAWRRLGALLAFFCDEANGYRSRLIPFREGDTSGPYDHLARVLEWSAGGDDGDAGEGS